MRRGIKAGACLLYTSQPSQSALKLIFVPYIVLIAKRKVVRLDRGIGCQREKIGANTLARAVPDDDILRAAAGEVLENFRGRIGRTVVRYEQAPVGMALLRNRFQLLAEKRSAVFRAHQYGDARGTCLLYTSRCV